MVAESSDPHGTAFHVSVDLRTRTTTGISARDRANTIKALAGLTPVAVICGRGSSRAAATGSAPVRSRST
jgi:3,4-dihydroxy-2-butanone 4-phosphate synthase